MPLYDAEKNSYEAAGAIRGMADCPDGHTIPTIAMEDVIQVFAKNQDR